MVRRITSAQFVATVSLLAVGLSGCTVGPNYRPKTAAELGVPEGYSVPTAQTREDLTRWWERFGDPD